MIQQVILNKYQVKMKLLNSYICKREPYKTTYLSAYVDELHNLYYAKHVKYKQPRDSIRHSIWMLERKKHKDYIIRNGYSKTTKYWVDASGALRETTKHKKMKAVKTIKSGTK